VIGTTRRECLDWVIPMSEKHLHAIRAEWSTHYNRARVHMQLGPGVPNQPRGSAVITKSTNRHRLVAGTLVLAKSVLNGLNDEYSLANMPETT